MIKDLRQKPPTALVHCPKCHSSFMGVGLTSLTATRAAYKGMAKVHTVDACARTVAANERAAKRTAGEK